MNSSLCHAFSFISDNGLKVCDAAVIGDMLVVSVSCYWKYACLSVEGVLIYWKHAHARP